VPGVAVADERVEMGANMNIDTGLAVGIVVDNDMPVIISLPTANAMRTSSPVLVLEDDDDDYPGRNLIMFLRLYICAARVTKHYTRMKYTDIFF